MSGGSRPKGDFVAGTRASRLALRQTEQVLGLLRSRWPEFGWAADEYSTRGDQERDSPLAEIGGSGAFTEAIERALAEGAISFAVHSLKDLPVESSSKLTIGAVVGPRIAGEVLVSRGGVTLAGLPNGAVVGTSSLRRQAQLLFRRPDLRMRGIRGNVETRIEKVQRGEYDATVLAVAGIVRLGIDEGIGSQLAPDILLPAPGQGAIAVQCRSDDERLMALLAAISDSEVEACTRAERRFLKNLGAGCSSPVAALAVAAEGGAGRQYHLIGRVAAPDGSRMVEVVDVGSEPEELGARLAEEALRRGAREILAGRSPGGPVRRAAGGDHALPLGGKRVVVTRPASQAHELSAALESEGAEVIALPVIELRPLAASQPLEEALARLSEFRWIVLASSNAVAFFFAALGERAAMLEGRIAVVGAQSAAAAAALGVPPAYISRAQTGAGLARELPEASGAEVLVPCAERHTEELPGLLRERGARVTVLPIYRTERVPIDRAGVEALRKGVDFVLFTSGSTVAGFIEGVREAAGDALLRGLLGRAKIACIGPSTAEAVRDAGFAPGIVATDHTADGLVASVVEAEKESVDE